MLSVATTYLTYTFLKVEGVVQKAMAVWKKVGTTACALSLQSFSYRVTALGILVLKLGNVWV